MVIEKDRIAGSVILYNSKSQVIANIHSYLSQIAHLFVIDNSEINDSKLVEQIISISNITYISNGGNFGVAYALNQAANMAIDAGYHFLLTMDDDTYFPHDGIDKMLSFINQFNKDIKIGILAGQSDPKLVNNTITPVLFTITSGSLLNLSAYKECGHFMDELFIDCVDHEYCFRIKKYGFEVIEINSIQLGHTLGHKRQITLFSYKMPLYWVSHNPLRIYYKTRNSIFSLKKYDSLVVKIKYIYFKEMLKDFFKIIFLENRKRTRIILFIKGIYDGIVGNLGKLTYER